MDSIREQMELTNEISDAISNPVGMLGHDVADEEDLQRELEELEQEQLDERLANAQPVPVHSPGPAVKVGPVKTRQEQEEEDELKELEAMMAS